MTVSQYIIKYLISKNITDIFGYPGGMVTHFMNELSLNADRIHTHITFHEQAASFAACGYAQSTNKVGVAFATSGPGATNLITGIATAYFDSIPTIFITGNVNTFESSIETGMRQNGFQEMNIISIVKSITKKAFYLENPKDIDKVLNEAFTIALSDRKGPILIDIPMDIFRSEVNDFRNDEIIISETKNDRLKKLLEDSLSCAKRPCLLVGNGIKSDNQVNVLRGILRSCPMPVVSSMIACDIVTEAEGLEGMYYGYIGAYGNRTANFVIAKSDLVICIGTRLSIRQVGGKRDSFAPNAKILRIDIDEKELNNKIREDDITIKCSLSYAIPVLRKVLSKCEPFNEWLNVCKEIKKHVKYIDEKEPNRIVNCISKIIPDEYGIVADIGQNMVWVAQSFKFKPNQRVYFAGSMGPMGYALPASIGIYYGLKKPVICFIGDGGIQMNIQELQFIKENKLPIKIFVINNYALGMIRHFQEMYYNENYCYTVEGKGYSTPDFCKVANAYGIKSNTIKNILEINDIRVNSDYPELFEIQLKDNTYIFPKLEYGKPNQDQEPLLDRSLYKYLMEL